MRTRSCTSRLNQTNGPNFRRSDLPVTHRQRSRSKSHSSQSASSASKVNTESSSLSNPKNKSPHEKPTLFKRRHYTDAEDYAILDYIITQKLIKKIRCSSTWKALETAGVSLHSADSMQFRFLNNIIYHFFEVLHCTPEGRAKYFDSAVAKKIHSDLLAFSQNPQSKSVDTSPLALSDLSFFTNDESPHDGANIKSKLLSSKGNSKSSSPRKSPLHKSPIKLVDYMDTQSNQTPPRDIPSTPVNCAEPLIYQRLSLSSTPVRRKGLRSRRLLFRNRDGSEDDVVVIDNLPSRSSERIQQQTIHLTRALAQFPRSQLSQSKETSSRNGKEEVEEEFSIDSNSSRKRKRGRLSLESGQVDLDASKELPTSEEGVNETEVVEIIPDSLPEANLDSSPLISGSREQPRSSRRLSDSLKFPLMDSQAHVSHDVLLSRSMDFTRKLDSFARHHQFTPSNAARLLHASSGVFEVASEYLKTFDRHLLWTPRDDFNLLSNSVSDIRSLISKFGQAAVSRRLIYHTNQSLLS